MIDAKEVRKDFPFFAKSDLAYLDNSATSQRLQSVLDAEVKFYEENNANPFRGLYDMSVRATEAYEDARETVRAFINAKEVGEIIFTRNASESLNLVAYSFGSKFFKEGDEILVSIEEHH